MKRFFINQEGNSNKFWNIEINKTNFIVTYGKIGTDGTSSTKKFSTPELCKKEAEKLITEKTKKGYKEVTQDEKIPVKQNVIKKKIKKTDILSQCKSIKQGTFTLEELTELCDKDKWETDIESALHDADDDEIREEWEYDILYKEGDLIIDGDFDTVEMKICGLYVTGNLIVNGLYRDYDYPQTFVVIKGNLKASNLITGGSLEVKGNVIIKENLIGFYNDYGAIFHDKTQANFFYPEVHSFEFNGSKEIKFEIEENDKKNTPIYELLSSKVFNTTKWDELGEEEQKKIIEKGEKYKYMRLDVEAIIKTLTKRESLFK